MSTALIIVDDFANKKKLSQYLQKNEHLALEFPRDITQSFELAQSLSPSLIIIQINGDFEAATKLCLLFKRSPATSHIPILLICPITATLKQQVADAYLKQNFTEKEFDQVIRQFTMGY